MKQRDTDYETDPPKGEDQFPEPRLPIRHSQIIASCGCPEQIVSQKESRTVFRDLILEQEYFPMVSRKDAQAFFGLPPQRLRPKAPEREIAIATKISVFSSPGCPRTTFAAQGVNLNDGESGSYNNLYDQSSSDSDDMETEMPGQPPSIRGSKSGSSHAKTAETRLNRPKTAANQAPKAPIGPTQAENEEEILRLSVSNISTLPVTISTS